MSDLGAPVRGEWLVLNPPGHQRHAFDLAAVDPRTGRLMSASRWRFLAALALATEVHGWSRPVMAPLTGEVVAAHDGEDDRHRLVPVADVPASFLVRPVRYRHRPEKMAGNHVVLHTPAGFVLLAHLESGSVQHRAGDRVGAGEQVGRVGNSGNSVGPHLHIQVMDGPDLSTGRVQPFRLARFSRIVDGRRVQETHAPLPDRATRVRFDP